MTVCHYKAIHQFYYWRITATFHSEGDEGDFRPVYAYIEYGGEIYDEKWTTWYFPPANYTMVMLDLHASTAYATMNYSMYVPSEDSVVACPRCGGIGYVTNWNVVKLVVAASLVVVIVLLLLHK